MVSPRKSSHALSLIPEERGKMMGPARSCESLFSNTSSSKESACVIYQTKLPTKRNGNGNGARQASIIPVNSEIRQRVISARKLRIKSIQNQLADAQHEIASLAHENRMLRTLHKRQDSALAKYESSNAELPQLLHSHAEELRVWQTKCRNLQQLNKEIEHRMKQKEAIILTLSDQNKHYSQLNKDKNLDERQRLQEKLLAMEQRLQEKDNDMKLMARKVQLEAKNFRQQLLNEQKKTKEVMVKLEKARLELSGYRKLEELTLGEKTNNIIPARRGKIPITEEPTKLEKLEKTLESLEKAEALNYSTTDDTDAQSLQNSSRSAKVKRTMSKIGMQQQPKTPPSKLASAKLSSTSRMQQLPSKLPIANKSPLHVKSPHMAIMRNASERIVSGGGDIGGSVNEAKFISELKSSAASFKAFQKKMVMPDTNSEYEDDFGRVEDEFTDDAGLETEIEAEESGMDDNQGDSDMAAYAAYTDEPEDTQTEGCSVDEDDDSVIMNTKRTTASMREDISSIRKQISDDYKEREAFLDTFCRQANNSGIRDDAAGKKRNSIAMAGHLAGSRKHILLAALKAIDDNKSQD